MKKTTLCYIILPLVCLLKLSCTLGEKVILRKETGDIHGKVYGPPGRKVVSLVGENSRTVTDVSGSFYFKDLLPGKYDVEVKPEKGDSQAAAYPVNTSSLLKNIVVSKNAVTMAPIDIGCSFTIVKDWQGEGIRHSNINQKGSIKGVVLNISKLEVFKDFPSDMEKVLKISLSGGVDNKGYTTWTDAAGHFSFDHLLPGIYSANASSGNLAISGFETNTTIKIIVLPFQTAFLEIDTSQNINETSILEAGVCSLFFTDWERKYIR